MNKKNLRDYSYLAGVLDSDGSFQIQKKKHYKDFNRYYYSPVLAVDQADTRIINWLYGRFGGNVGIAKHGDRVTYHGLKQIVTEKDLFYWRKYLAIKDTALLKNLVSLLKIKKKQAEILLRLIYLKPNRTNGRKRVYTDRLLEQMQYLKDLLSEEKKTYFTDIPTSSFAATSTKQRER